MLRRLLKNWLQLGFWVFLIVAVFAMTALGNRRLPDPPGWQVWHDCGSILDLASFNGQVIAGGYQGLRKYACDGTVTEVNSPGIQDWQVRSLEPLADNRLMIGHTQGLAVMLPGGEVSSVEWPEQPVSQVECIEYDPSGRIWVGTKDGIFVAGIGPVADQLKLERWDQAGALNSARVFACLAQVDGGVWFGTYIAPDGGVSYYSDQGWQHWTTESGLPHANITSLLEASDGSVWAGCGFQTAGGAARFARDNSGWQLVETLDTEELAGPKVRSIFEDSRGWIWFGSEQDGLAIRINGETKMVLKDGSGLPHLEVMSFMEAADGAMWIGTLNGLACIDQLAVENLLKKPGIR